MSYASDQNRIDPEDHTSELHRQLHKFSNAIAEFEAMGSELKARRPDARTADMIRLNRETINAIRRSAELVEERLKLAEIRTALRDAKNSNQVGGPGH